MVVTVAGTGSECNGGAVITNEEKRIKTLGGDYPKLNPRFALMDPTYTFSVPKRQMVSGSFDILSHIMETYFSEPNEDNVSDDLMEALMKSVIRNLRTAIQDPSDYTARSNLMWDATMAENRLTKWAKNVTLSVTTWNTSWAPIPTATMAAAWLCSTRVLPSCIQGGPAQVCPVCGKCVGDCPGRQVGGRTGPFRH